MAAGPGGTEISVNSTSYCLMFASFFSVFFVGMLNKGIYTRFTVCLSVFN